MEQSKGARKQTPLHDLTFMWNLKRKKSNIIIESKMVVTGDGEWGQRRDVGQKVQISVIR